MKTGDQCSAFAEAGLPQRKSAGKAGILGRIIMKISNGLLRSHLATGSALAIAVTLAALPAQASAQAAAAQPPAPAAQTDSGALTDIIVTAQRRSENLQEVPIAVTAVTADALRNNGINATSDLPQAVPSVQLTRSGPSGLFFIRGVGTTNAAAGEEGANAVYIDGVYIGDLGQTFNNFNNIDRVEVLKGPQGTLFGRNTTGGLIHIITREPNRDHSVFDGQIGYANYNTVSSQGYVSLPVTNTVAVDFAYTVNHQNDGWGRNLTRNSDNKVNDYKGIRSKILFRPSDNLKFVLAGDYYVSDDNLGLGWRIADGTVGTGGNVGPTGNNGHDTTSNEEARTRLKIWGLSFTTEADLGFATLTNIAAVRRSENRSKFDVDGGPLNLVNIDYLSTGRTVQEEIRLASKSTNPISWQVGFFYLHSEAASDPQNQTGAAFAAAGLAGLSIRSSLKTDSYAGFGEATWTITPTTKLTGGVRYTSDSRHFQGTTQPILFSGVIGPAIAASSNPGADLNYNEFTYRASLRQEITDDISVYASFNHGFKAGAFSLQSPANAPVQPQYIDAFEGGIKSELFDRKLRLNLAGYHYDISNYQVRSAASANPGANILLNAATVKVNGFDAEFEAAPTRALHLFGGLTVLDSTFARFGGPGALFQSPISYPNPATCPAALIGTKNPGVLGAGPRTGGVTTCFGDVSGLQTPLAPKFTASFGASLTIPTSATGEIRASALYAYNSGYVFEPDNVAKQGAFDLVNASLEYRPSKTIGVELWVKNLLNTRYAVQDLTTGTGITEADGAPRTYGVNVKFHF
jgi:iron complex outermembrane receptor protein